MYKDLRFTFILNPEVLSNAETKLLNIMHVFYWCVGLINTQIKSVVFWKGLNLSEKVENILVKFLALVHSVVCAPATRSSHFLYIWKRAYDEFLCVHTFCAKKICHFPLAVNFLGSSWAVTVFLALPGSADTGSLHNAVSLPLSALAPLEGNKWTPTQN